MLSETHVEDEEETPEAGEKESAKMQKEQDFHLYVVICLFLLNFQNHGCIAPQTITGVALAIVGV